jgi:hypothetical protein
MRPHAHIQLTLFVAALVTAILAGSSATLKSQAGGRVGELPLMIENLRPSGQPVIPIFDGWYQRPDGTHDLCFAYFSLNLQEELDIPVGPDNFVEPKEFNGNQPTHFHPVPAGYRRHYCAFVVNVPKDFAKRRVVWTLRRDGQSYSVPGHIERREYILENSYMRSEDRVAPSVQFIAPTESKPVRGRQWNLAGPAIAIAGTPVELRLSVTDAEPAPTEGERKFDVYWYLHSGPSGNVTFRDKLVRLPNKGGGIATNLVTFAEPGDYVLRAVALDGDFFTHCCFTNSFLKVSVKR